MQNLKEVVCEIEKLNLRHKRIGLITGCFDILHIGHLNLIRRAKDHVDILVIGLENDSSIKISKGNNRPVNALKNRYEMLSELKSVDYIFTVEQSYRFGTKEASEIHKDILSSLSPTHIFSTPTRDQYLLRRREVAKRLNIKLVEIESEYDISSTEIIGKSNWLRDQDSNLEPNG